MPLRIIFDPRKSVSSPESAKRFSDAFQKDLGFTITPAVFQSYRSLRIVKFSQFVEKVLQGRSFGVEVESGARVRLENIEVILSVRGLTDKIKRIVIKQSESDNSDIVPMACPVIKDGILYLKANDLSRPPQIVRKAISNALQSSPLNGTHQMAPRETTQIEGMMIKRGLNLSDTDRALLWRTEILNCDPLNPDHAYHYEIIGALFSPVQTDGLAHTQRKYIYDILEKIGLPPEEINKIVIEGALLVDNISFDLGTRREVDRITVIDSSGKRYSFTASLDKEAHSGEGLTHSEEEFNTLLPIHMLAWRVVQALYGICRKPVGASNHRAIIFKEYLEGVALGLIYENLTLEQKQAVAAKVGEMLGRFYGLTDSAPGDMNNLNVIVNDTAEGISCRICDLSNTEKNKKKIALTIIPSILKEYRGEEEAILFGFSRFAGKKAIEILTIMQLNPTYGGLAKKILVKLFEKTQLLVKPK